MTPTRKLLVGGLVLLVACGALAVPASRQRPSERDDEVFLQAAYLVRTEGVSPIEGITRAAANQYGWGGDLAHRLRTQGDIQTYALIPVWSRIGGFHARDGSEGRPLYVDSARLRHASFAFFVLAVFAMAWAVLPLGRGTALAAALLLAFTHPFRLGPTLFDVWVMPFAIAAVGCWLRGRHELVIAASLVAILVKPNYVFLLPALGLASLVAASREDRRRLVLSYGGALAFVGAAYLALAAAHVIALGQYTSGVRSGYDLRVLAYSALETLSLRYRAGTQQLRSSWPVFPWTFVNLVALLALGAAARRTASSLRTAVGLGLLIAVPLLANFTVLPSVAAYEDGGHFRWVNVSILAITVALPLGYRELAAAVAQRWLHRPAAATAA
jgi:hypothetical protein